MSPLEKIKSHILKAIAEVVPNSSLTSADIVPTPNPALGDLAVPSFKLAKVMGKAPGAVVEELRAKWPGAKFVASVEAAGPYLNVRLDRAAVTKEIFAAMSKKSKVAYGNAKKTKKRTMVEFISPNVNKPLHLGHLRNAVLGESVCRLLEAVGEKVVRADLLNDRGVGITRAMVAYERWGGTETPASTGEKGDHFVGRYYVLFDKKSKEDPALGLDEAVSEKLRAWEAGDKSARSLWRTMIKWCADGQNETVKMLGVKFDKVYRESALYEDGKEMVLEALEAGKFSKDEKGNVIAKIEGKPDKVVLRADGTAVYVTTDIALTVKKVEENKLASCLWIVGSEQDLHLVQLFSIMRILGYAWADRLEHVSYGHVALPEGRMKSREGTVVDVDDLLAHLSGLAKEEIRARHDFLDEREVEKRAEAIALGAVKYYLLSVSAESGMTFNPKESLSFAGKTGPYLQYTNARLLSILRKAADSKPSAGRIDFSLLTEPAEWQIALSLAAFPDVIASAASRRDPSVVAKYCFDLAKSFSEFYEQLPVLKAENSVRRARLSLVRAVSAVLERGMHVLAIPVLKEM